MNFKIKTLIVISVLTFTTSNIFAADMRSDIKYLVSKYKLQDAKISIAADRTNSGKRLYSFADDRDMIPASNNKVFTMVSALLTIPSNYRFITSVNYPGANLKNHTLNGDMYISFSGNPALTGGQLSSLISKIKTEKGINNITGNVYLVGKFSGPYVPKGWSKEDQTFCYGAPASSFTMNRNCMVVKLYKNKNSTSTSVSRISNASNISIHNDTSYTNSHENTIVRMDDDNNLYFSGYLSRASARMFSLAIENPALKTLDTVNDFLNSKGIKHGKVLITSTLPSNYTPQITTSSATLGSFIDRTLKKSDNLYAETLLNTVGLHHKGVGSTEAGVESVKEVLNQQLRLNTKDLTMYDGSGLSHLDHVTTSFMVDFLSKSFNSKIGKSFYNYLPVSGISGTIAYRMNNKRLISKVHAKTGTLAGVSTLSGYVLTAKNHRVSFSIMLNDLKGSDRNNTRRFQDKVVDIFYRYL